MSSVILTLLQGSLTFNLIIVVISKYKSLTLYIDGCGMLFLWLPFEILWLASERPGTKEYWEVWEFTIIFAHHLASFPVVLGDFGCDVTADVTCQACRENSPRTPRAIALGSKPPLVTRIARTGLGTRLHITHNTDLVCLPSLSKFCKRISYSVFSTKHFQNFHGFN